MVIDRNTKLADILAGYPDIKDKLPTINERFQMLSTPIAKVMLKTATIADMSRRSGMDADDLVRKLSLLTSA